MPVPVDLCSFCRKPREERKVFFVAADGHVICDKCAVEAKMVLESFEADDEPDPDPTPIQPRAKVIQFNDVIAEAVARRAEAA